MTFRSLRWLVYRGNRAFTWVWWSQTISLFGSQVTLVAVPLLAAIGLQATPFQMGLLAAAEMVPYIIFSIPAGVLADRLSRRGLLIVCNLGRATLLLAIPASAAYGLLSLPSLFAIALGIGTLSVLFDVAYQSYVPELLAPSELLDGNQRLELSESAARTAGPGIGGALVASVGSAAAVIVDAFSFLVASIALLAARPARASAAASQLAGEKGADIARQANADDALPTAAETLESASRFASSLDEKGIDAWDYISSLEKRIADLERRLASAKSEAERSGERGTERKKTSHDGGAWTGFAIVLRDSDLRAMAGSTAVFNLASAAIMAVFILFAARDLAMDPASIGVLIGAGNVGFILGALAVGSVTNRLGVGGTLIASAVLGAVATLVFPLAVGPYAAAVLLAGRFIGAFAIPFFNVNARALRQSRAPHEALGRVNAVFRLIDWGTLPIGALAGGWIGTVYGLRATLGFAAVLGVVSALWLALSSIRRVRTLEGGAVDVSMTPEPVRREWGRPAVALGHGLALTIGRPLVAVGGLELKWSWLAVSAVLLQVILFVPPGRPLGPATPILYVLSCLAVLACVLRNARIPGLLVVALGGLSNLAAITANGGLMPVSPEAARVAGHLSETGHAVNTMEMSNPALAPLTDVLAVPPPLPFANVYSVGDVLIVLGLLLTVVWAIRRSGAGSAGALEHMGDSGYRSRGTEVPVADG